MLTITKEELEEKIKLHQDWLDNIDGGKRLNLKSANLESANLGSANLENAYLEKANLKNAYLGKANLKNANLENANLENANLENAYLGKANLEKANLENAYLENANLENAYLEKANFKNAYLENANLENAYLENVYLENANLKNANLKNANLENVYLENAYLENANFYNLSCPEEGAFIGWKKANDKIIKLRITENALRSSATSYKCRCSEALVLEIEDGLKEIVSDHDKNFIYKVGEIVKADDFNPDRWVECGKGIHFFMNKQNAINY